MDATNRIAEEFDRLLALGLEGVATRSAAEQIVYYVVTTRCEMDIDGFASVFEQDLNPRELAILIDGLEQIAEPELAAEFRQGFALLRDAGFYEHLSWPKVPDEVKDEIDAIGERVGQRLWDLDEKLAALLDTSLAE